MPGRGGLTESEGVAQARVGDTGAGAGPPASRRAKQCPPPTKGPAAVSSPAVVAAALLAGVWWAGEIGWGAGAAAAAVPLGDLWWAGERGWGVGEKVHERAIGVEAEEGGRWGAAVAPAAADGTSSGVLMVGV